MQERVEFIKETIEIAKPIEEHFSVDMFTYANFYQDGHACCLLNHAALGEIMNNAQQIDENVFVHFKQLMGYQGGQRVFTHQQLKDQPFGAFLQQEFDVKDGVVVVNNTDFGIETFSYVSTSNESLTETFFSNFDIFSHYEAFFKDRGEQLVKRIRDNKTYIPSLDSSPQQDVATDQALSNFAEKYPINHYAIAIDNGEAFLTHGEYRCLQLHVTGMTAKEIGYQLGISARTVETHLDNIKQKIGCKRKGQITYQYFKNNNHF